MLNWLLSNYVSAVVAYNSKKSNIINDWSHWLFRNPIAHVHSQNFQTKALIYFLRIINISIFYVYFVYIHSIIFDEIYRCHWWFIYCFFSGTYQSNGSTVYETNKSYIKTTSSKFFFIYLSWHIILYIFGGIEKWYEYCMSHH